MASVVTGGEGAYYRMLGALPNAPFERRPISIVFVQERGHPIFDSALNGVGSIRTCNSFAISVHSLFPLFGVVGPLLETSDSNRTENRPRSIRAQQIQSKSFVSAEGSKVMVLRDIQKACYCVTVAASSCELGQMGESCFLAPSTMRHQQNDAGNKDQIFHRECFRLLVSKLVEMQFVSHTVGMEAHRRSDLLVSVANW